MDQHAIGLPALTDEGVKKLITVIHDLDFPVYQRSICVRRALWLLALALFGNRKWLFRRMPSWVAREKYMFTLALARIDLEQGVKAVFGLTRDVQEVFPDLRGRLESMGFEVRDHSHIKAKVLGRGVWDPPLKVKPENMIYDRLYVMKGRTALPSDGEAVVWHADHPFNLDGYLEFLERAKQKGLL